MPDLDYAKVMQRLGLTVGDGADPDETPDTIWCDGGTVQIVPLNTYVKVADGSPVPWTGGNAVIECTVTDADFVDPTSNGFDGAGYLLFNGKPFVWVVDLTSTKVNPTVATGATHRINYVNVTAEGTPVTFPSVDVRLTAAGDGTSPDNFNDLTLLSPVVPGAATPIYPGPRGVSVESMTVTELGELEVELDDGTTVNAGELPVGPGGSDAGVAGYLAAEESESREALDQAAADLLDIPTSALAIKTSASYVPAGSAFLDLGRQSGVDPTGVADSTTGLQDALDSATAFGVRSFAVGTFKTTGTLTIAGNVDMGDAVINYSGTGVAIEVKNPSAPGYLIRKDRIRLPRVVNTAKTVTGWAQVAGSVGVKLTNLYSCMVTVPEVKNFETGLLVYGESSNGTSYTAVTIGHLNNNKVNLQLNSASTGWTNQNTFIGGRCSHDSGEGSQVTGTRNVLLSNSANKVNNNEFLNMSIESPDVVEYHIECFGQYNYFKNNRFENTGGDSHRRIWWRNAAKGNVIQFGFNSGQITEVTEAGAGFNELWSDIQKRFGGGSTTRSAVLIENEVSSSGPALRILPAGTVAAGTDPATAWTVESSAQKLKGRRNTDARSRIEVDYVNGRVYVSDGTGSGALTQYIGAFGTVLGIDGAHLYWATNNTYDIGGTSNKPRDIRLGRDVLADGKVTAGSWIKSQAVATGSRPSAVTAGAGSMIYDTTLSKPIWSDGTVWRDAAGTAV